MGERKRYSKEFKQEAVRLAKEPDRSVLQVAQNLGISDSALHRWIRELEGHGGAAFPGHGKQVLTPEQAEIKRLKRELDIARQERDVLKKAVALLRQGQMSAFEFIERHREEFRLDVMCRMLSVTKSGYFTWRGRPISTRKTRDAELKDEIERIHTQSKGRYGVPRVHAELRRRARSARVVGWPA